MAPSPDERLTVHFEPASRDAGYDLRSRDGRFVVGHKNSVASARDLYAGLIILATALGHEGEHVRAVFVAGRSVVSPSRIREEWQRITNVLRPAVARRLAVVILSDPPLCLPDEPEVRALAEELRLLLTTNERKHNLREDHPAHGESRVPTIKFFEVWKVLLAHWLLQQEALRIGELMREANCSHPTVIRALQRMEERREIRRLSNRSVELVEFPHETFGEALALAESLRTPIRFVDAAGANGDPAALLRRLERVAEQEGTPKMALGGVSAARHYDPEFDLEGTPRIDVSVHTFAGEPELGFVNQLDPDARWVGVVGKVDPALRRTSRASEAILVVHPLRRRESLFVRRDRGMPLADPVETLFDLHDLRLHDQAEAMVRRLRAEKRR